MSLYYQDRASDACREQREALTADLIRHRRALVKIRKSDRVGQAIASAELRDSLAALLEDLGIDTENGYQPDCWEVVGR